MNRIKHLFPFLLMLGLLGQRAVGADADSKPNADRQLKEIEDFAKAAETIVLHSSASQLDAIKREVLENIYNICGLRMPEGKKVTVMLGSGSGAAAVTWARPTGAHIVFMANVMQQNKRDYKEVFQHEMVHAIQDSWWGTRHGQTVPVWIKEGLATYVAGNGPRRVSRFQGNLNILNGLGNHQFGKSSDYTEAYLAILFIEQKWGADTLKKFVRAITVDQTPWETALQENTGLEFKEFAARARQFSIAQLTSPSDAKQTAQNLAPQAAAPRPSPTPAQAEAAAPQVPASFVKLDLGISAQDSDGKGVLIIAVNDDGAAARAGIEAGDVLVSINGKAVANTKELRTICESVPTGAPIPIECSRDGKRVLLEIPLKNP